MIGTTSIMTQSCRFCYNYNQPTNNTVECRPIVSATSTYLSSIACSKPVTNNSANTTQHSLLIGRKTMQAQQLQSTFVASTLQTILANTSSITTTLNAQLLQTKEQRYAPYLPYIPPVIPSSVMQLRMATANVGVAVTPITCKTGKGSQFVTK